MITVEKQVKQLPLYILKAKQIYGFKSCIAINVYPLDIPSIKKATEYHNN